MIFIASSDSLTPITMFTNAFHITNLSCEACIKLSTRALKEIPGVAEATADLKTGKTVITATREIPKEEIIQRLREVDKVTDL